MWHNDKNWNRKPASEVYTRTHTHAFTCIQVYNYRHWKKQKRKPIWATSSNNLFITLLTSKNFGLSYEHVLLPLRFMWQCFFSLYFSFCIFLVTFASLFFGVFAVVLLFVSLSLCAHFCKKRNWTNYNNLCEWLVSGNEIQQMKPKLHVSLVKMWGKETTIETHQQQQQ